MYTDPSNIIKTVIEKVFVINADWINAVIQVYEPDRVLTVFEGMRKSLPRDAFPSLEIEPTGASNMWATTRAQRPTYNFEYTLTVINDNEKYGVEYIAAIITRILELINDPRYLQLEVLNESRWDPNAGLVATFILDSLATDVTYNASKEGTVRTAQFSWFAMIHEPFPNSKFNDSDLSMPTIIRPDLITVP